MLFYGVNKWFMFLVGFIEQHDVKVSVNDIVIKAVALALKSVPTANGMLLEIYVFCTQVCCFRGLLFTIDLCSQVCPAWD